MPQIKCYCVYYGLKESIFDMNSVLFVTGRNMYNSFIIFRKSRLIVRRREDVIAFTFAKHGCVMIVDQCLLKRLHVFLWW